MPETFTDRLLEAIDARRAPVCVGIDPRYDRLPPSLRTADAGPGEQLAAIRTFCMSLVDILAGVVPVVKPQIAYFEAYRGEGMSLYFDVVRHARKAGLLVIGDVKRNDIGSTAEAYARGHMIGAEMPDAITVNGYFGADGLAPFVDAARETGRGLFVLVRTSNPSAAAVQDFCDAGGTPFYEHIAREVARIGRGDGLRGQCDFSSVGAVVGATYPEEARALRRIMPEQIFLVPGYGAQGASADDCGAAFDDRGRGAVVNASRSVIYAYRSPDCAAGDWKQAVGEAAEAFAADLRRITYDRAG